MYVYKQFNELEDKLYAYILKYFKWPGYGMEDLSDYPDWDADKTERCIRTQMSEEWKCLYTDTQVRFVDCRNYSYTQDHLFGPAFKESKDRWEEFLKDVHREVFKPFYEDFTRKFIKALLKALDVLKKDDVPASELHVPYECKEFLALSYVGRHKEFPNYNKHLLGLKLIASDNDEIKVMSAPEFGRFQLVNLES